MLSNAYFLAKFRFDTAENEPAKNLQNLQNFANLEFSIRVDVALGDRRVAVEDGPEDVVRQGEQRGRRGTGRRHDGRSAKFRQNVARFRLYRHRSLQVNKRFAAFFNIYQII